MSRKMFAALMSFVLVITLLAACSGGGGAPSNPAPSTTPGGSSEGSGAPSEPEEDLSAQYGDTGGLKLPIVDEPVKISFLVVSDTTDLDESWVVQELEKRTGIDLDVQFYSAATFRERLNVIMGSGNLPDIMHGLTVAEVNELGGRGVFAPINDYLDQLPNFRALYAENPENDWVMKSYSDDSGNLYTWPTYGLNREVNHGFLYRKDIFDQHGIPLWTNTEEFYQALKKLKEIYPDSYPFASKTLANIFRDFGYGWGISGHPASYDEESGQWEFAYTMPEYKDMLDFMKRLYNDGLLDPEFITDTQANWTTKMTTDKAFVTFDWIGRLDMFYDQVKDVNPSYDLRYGNPVGPNNTIRSLPMISNAGHAVRNNDKAEVAMKLLDYLTSPSGAELMTLGQEGVNYEFDENGKVTYPELANHSLIEIKLLEETYGMWAQAFYVRTDRRSVYYNYTEKEQEAQDMMKDMKTPLDPVLKFTDEENSIKADLTQTLTKAAEEFSARYVITPSHGDAEWNAWLEQAKQLGADELTKVHNDAQARFNAE